MSKLQNCIQSFVEQLTKVGLEHVVICPGSRNGPLIQAFLSQKIQHHSVIDERSAGYVAMGMAQQVQKPVAVVCTSGTAAANLIPASIEAYYSGIPILLITADRPPELIDQWDGQCIRQVGLFSNHISGEYSCPDEYSNPENFQQIAMDAYAQCFSPNGGPVHINVPLREPLYNRAVEHNTPLDVPNLPPHKSEEKHLEQLKHALASYDNVLLVNGANFVSGTPEATDWSIPVLSDIVSNRKAIENIPHWDALLNGKNGNLADLKPDLLISTGRATVSKSLKQFLREYKPQKHLHLSLFDFVGDPFKSNPEVLKIVESDLWKLLSELEDRNGFKNNWLNNSKAFQQNLPTGNQSWNEMEAVQEILELLPKSSIVHLSNSMAVRYASFVLNRPDLELFCNRGTSGIEGCSSTAVGASLVTQKQVTLISGDISFFYDINALWQNELPHSLKIVVLNNGGGEIFNLIEGPANIPEAIPFQTTPHQRSAKTAASEFGLNYFCASDYMELNHALSEWQQSKLACILEIKTNPKRNKEFYTQFKNIEI